MGKKRGPKEKGREGEEGQGKGVGEEE